MAKHGQTVPRLIIFARQPILGKVKTRLAADIGERSALEFYRFLLDKTIDLISREKRECVWFWDREGKHDVTLPGSTRVHYQKGDSLGERLSYAFEEAFSDNRSPVVLIGTDCPGIDLKCLEAAFRALENYDAVIGPAYDGGYYLIGLNRFNAELFTDIKWGSNLVLEQTLDKMQDHRISHVLLDVRSDIDTLADIRYNGLESMLKDV